MQTATQPSSESALPEVTKYLDYRAYLHDWYLHKKAVQPSFSGAVFAKKAGIRSHSLLGMVIKGNRNLTYRTLQSFVLGLELKGTKAKFFENLVLYNQAKTHEEQIRYLKVFNESRSLSSPNIQKLQDSTEYLSAWYIAAIRELTRVPGFKEDSEWISKKMKKLVTPVQAKKAINILKRLNLLKNEGQIDIHPDRASPALREFYKSFFHRMIHAVDHESMQEREMNSLTLAVSHEEIAEINNRIKEAILLILRDYGKPHSDKRVVLTLQTQTLQLTQSD